MAKRKRTRKSGHLGALNIQDFDHGLNHLSPDDHRRVVAYRYCQTFLSGFRERDAAEYERITGSPGMVHAVEAIRSVYTVEHERWDRLCRSPGTVVPEYRKGK